MFTGLIERVGVIERKRPRGRGAELTIGFGLGEYEVKAGDSVAVDGACLTVSEVERNAFTVAASEETLTRTTLQSARKGTAVNLERALRLGDRLGGHLVTGHVDAVGRIVESRVEGDFRRMTIAAPPEVMTLVVEKGSIAVDGISLTVNALTSDRFHLMLIPETLSRTTLGRKRVGDLVNLETDLLGKYVARLLGQKVPGADSSDLMRKLGQAGFL